MTESNWHFERVELARYFYDLLIDTPANSVSLFGERRIGKTQFLVKDLAPYARDMGHTVIYADLWSLKDAPLAVLLKAMDDTLNAKEKGWKKLLRATKASLVLKPPGFSVGVEIDMKDMKGKAQENHFNRLMDYCRALANDDKPTFLLIDEFQQLARSKNTEGLIAALRAILQELKDGMVTVFTGSSQTELRAMLNAVDAPFYQFSEQEVLPKLDDAFIKHQLRVLKTKRENRNISFAEARKVFDMVEGSPLFFQKWVIKLTHPSNFSPEGAADRVLKDLETQQGFKPIWEKLSPIQRATARLVAEGKGNVYAQDFLEELSKRTNISKVEKPLVQNAIRRLTTHNIVETENGARIIPDPLFAFWIRSRPEEDFQE